jgi:diguanylate cyclase (GGDEF)-like protein
MTMTTPFVFEGYEELIRKPLERADPRSFGLIRKLLEGAPDSPGVCPFSFLIESLSAVSISQREARHHWKKITEHKRRLEVKLCRTVHIRTASIDYFDQLGVDLPCVSAQGPAHDRKAPEASAPRASGTIHPSSGILKKTISADDLLPERTGFYQERLKEEMMRARRYKHALSVILFDVELRAAVPETAEKTLSIIMKLINKAVRTVDILARHSDDLFLLMLPNTNKREALELAERLRNNICQRINRIPELSAGGIPITIALGQCSKDDTAADFIKRLERLAETGKRTTPAAICMLE